MVNEKYNWGDTVVVKASAKTYAGVPVQGALVGSIGDVFLWQFLDGSEDGIRAACTKGRMIREMAHQL